MRAHLMTTLMIASLAAGPSAVGQVYHAVELPMLPGGTSATARAVSESGVVVGSSNTSLAGYPEAVIWLEEGPVYIAGTGLSVSTSYDINESGTVVGITEEIPGGFVWQGEDYEPVGATFAAAVNDQGVIAGSLLDQATLWHDGVPTPLPGLADCCSNALDISNAGVAVGEAWNAENRSVAVRWADGGVEIVADFGGTVATAHAVNEAGQVVGEAALPFEPGGFFETRAFLWENGTTIELPTLGGLSTGAYAINSSGDIVGRSSVRLQAPRAVIWRDGEVVDLNDLVVSGATDLDLARADDINDAGQIVGTTYDGRAFRLDPLETPPCPADTNGDGVVDVTDLVNVIVDWGTDGSAHGGDVSADGVVDVNDLAGVIVGWGAC